MGIGVPQKIRKPCRTDHCVLGRGLITVPLTGTKLPFNCGACTTSRMKSSPSGSDWTHTYLARNQYRDLQTGKDGDILMGILAVTADYRFSHNGPYATAGIGLLQTTVETRLFTKSGIPLIFGMSGYALFFPVPALCDF